ncbi:MAG: DUF1385 domain-containing protein [Anaerolineales bacterium]
MEKLPTYGGQALIEGVMMRGGNAVAMAMRAPDRQIVVQTEKLGGIYKSGITKIPFLRGLVMLWDALGLGMRALVTSANLQTGEDEQLEGPALYLSLGTSMLAAVALFFWLPAGAAQLGEHYLHFGMWGSNITEGVARLLILIGYIWLIGRMEDIRRVFSYHGAEHKTINAYEAGAELTPESVARYPLEHPRCGTAFLLTLVLVSILVFTLIAPFKPADFSPLLWKLLTRLLFIPILAGVAYEYQRWTAGHLDSPLVRWLIRPNLALQRLTTNEPSLDMLEVAIAAFNAMRAAEQEVVL